MTSPLLSIFQQVTAAGNGLFLYLRRVYEDLCSQDANNFLHLS